MPTTAVSNTSTLSQSAAVIGDDNRTPSNVVNRAIWGQLRDEMLKTIEDYVIKLNEGLGYDFNTVEFAIRDGVPYAIDFCNPAPDADLNSVGQENFDWVVETAANYAIERAQALVPGKDNLSWGTFMADAVGAAMKAKPVAKASRKTTKAAPKKKATPKKKR